MDIIDEYEVTDDPQCGEVETYRAVRIEEAGEMAVMSSEERFGPQDRWSFYIRTPGEEWERQTWCFDGWKWVMQ